REAVHSQIAAALDLVVHLVREPGGGRRRVAEICLLRRGADGLVGVIPAVSFAAAGEVVPAEGADALAARLGHHWRRL
ncbi:pilus assembly protein CpaF, partial [Actinomadura adrarensis]